MVRSQKVINLSHFRKDSDLLLRAFLFLEGEPLRASFTPITVQDLPDRCLKTQHARLPRKPRASASAFRVPFSARPIGISMTIRSRFGSRYRSGKLIGPLTSVPPACRATTTIHLSL